MEYRQADEVAADAMGWREWEKRVAGILRANGWVVYHDRVVPKSLGGGRSAVQKAGRKSGLPDFVAYRLRADGTSELAFVECKTGRGKVSDAQQGWIRAANGAGGRVVGIVAYPSRRDELVERLGGVCP